MSSEHDFMARFEQWRTANGIPQEKVGEVAGVTQSAVSRWKASKHGPRKPVRRLLEKFMAEHSGERA
jgi:transcriptional regulator with XRE-family HTH domain